MIVDIEADDCHVATSMC